MLRAWLLHTFGPRLAVDDVMQEAFLRVLRAHTAGELQAPKAFLFAIARNLALDQVRRHHIARTDSLVEVDLSNVLDDNESMPETVTRNQEIAILTEAIQSLPTRCRQIMTLRIVYGLTQRVIGEKLRISDRTVAAQLVIGTRKCTAFVLRRLERPPLTLACDVANVFNELSEWYRGIHDQRESTILNGSTITFGVTGRF